MWVSVQSKLKPQTLSGVAINMNVCQLSHTEALLNKVIHYKDKFIEIIVV